MATTNYSRDNRACEKSFNSSFNKVKRKRFECENALKQEMFEDLEYTQSLKKEVDELESEKTEFSNEYDLLLQENQPVVRQRTAFKSERSSFSKNQFASQVVEKNTFTKPVTPHSWPQVRQFMFAKRHHVNACDPFRNSSERMSFQSPKESVGSNDMVHNYYLEEAKKCTPSGRQSFEFKT
ncbi:hypothetical protein Tco_0603293 [Tanacetum coccineum]